MYDILITNLKPHMPNRLILRIRIIFTKVFKTMKRLLFLPLQRVVSSVGLERMLDRHEVTGSNPVQPTFSNEIATFSGWLCFF